MILVLDAPVKQDELAADGIEMLDDVYKRWTKGDCNDLSLAEPYHKAIKVIKLLQDKRVVMLQDLLN